MLLRKMMRDMKINITQFISIFLMALLGVFICSGLNAAWYGMQTASDDFYKETNLADLWVLGEQLTEANLNQVESITGVSDASLRLTFDGVAHIGSRPTLRLNIVSEDIISKPKTVDGIGFDTSQAGIWLDQSFAKANNLHVGDTIIVEYSGIRIEKNILGLVMHPEYVHNTKDETVITPNSETFGYSYMPAKSVKGIEALNPLPYNQILISLDDGANKEKVQVALEKLFSDRFVMIMNHKTHPSIAMFNNEIDQTKALSDIFPVVFFLIAALTLVTTMTRLTLGQRTQIATLKAIGFSKRKILFHYLSYGLWLGLISGIIGLFIGPIVLAPILFEMQKTLYTLPQWPTLIAPVSVVAVIIVVFCCGASSYLACRKQLKEVPASGLRPLAPKSQRHTNVEKSKLWHLIGFSTQWNLRDVLRSKLRTVMAIIGVMGSTALLLFGLGLLDTIEDINRWQYEELNVFETRIDLDDNTSSEFQDNVYNRYGGQWIQESGIELKKDSIKKNGVLTVLSEGGQAFFNDIKGQNIDLPKSGIALSNKIALSLNVSKGDTILWRIYGEKAWRESEIKAIYRTPMGQGISMTEAAFKGIGKQLKPTALLSSKKVADAKDLAGIKAVQNKEQLKSGFDQVIDSMLAIVVILIVASFILGSVVLYNLGILSFSERVREFATLKVLGFFPKKIQGLMLKQNIWTTLIGILLGIPAGYALVEYMMTTMSDSMDMRTYISLASWLISILGVFILSISVSMFLSRKIKHIDMVSSLKSVE